MITFTIETEKLLNQKNPEIANIVTSILMDQEDPNRQLSNWESKNIEVKSETEVLTKSVNDVVFNLRRVLIEELVKERLIIEKEYSNEEKEEIMNYNSLRIRLFEKLNRVV